MRILITNNTIARRGGSELYVRDLAIALMKRGHDPVVFSTILGAVAEELRQATVPVVDDLSLLGATPDIIHGHHHIDTMIAALHFPKTPAVFVCHGWLPWEERPPLFPSIRRYVAVSHVNRERLLMSGVPEDRVEVMYNFVDLARFHSRPPLPDHPKTALIFGNNMDYGKAIRAACARAKIERIDVAGGKKAVAAPESILHQYDVVFAVGRCALEAMASGCAVVLTDFAGLGGLVTSSNVETLRDLNFGLRATQGHPITADTMFEALQAYDPQDAAKVSQWIRDKADMSLAVTGWLDLYEDVVEEWERTCQIGTPPSPDMQLQAASDYLHSLVPRLKPDPKRLPRLQMGLALYRKLKAHLRA